MGSSSGKITKKIKVIKNNDSTNNSTACETKDNFQTMLENKCSVSDLTYSNSI